MAEPKLIPLAMLMEPDNPLRIEVQEGPLDELVESIKIAGILSPLLVVPWFQDHEGALVAQPDAALGKVGEIPSRYEIRCGHRRYMAARRLELDAAPCMVFENSEDSRYLIMLHEQVVRADVTPVEEGVLFLQLAEQHHWSMDDLVRVFKRSENYINDRVEIVQKDTAVASAVQAGAINLGQAKQILRPKDPAFRTYLLDQAATHGANTRTLQQMIVNKEQEAAAAQGQLKRHTPELATTPEAPPAMVCIWCRSGDNPEHLRVVQVHWFHQKDLEAVCEQLGVHNLHKAVAGNTGTV
jgi:ParB family transcriptional regulator, chromosome partitioning protein